tara:strand:+ start:1023 stop:1436 length:414 start_codon:yes stop_codon:yes gene_type:complete
VTEAVVTEEIAAADLEVQEPIVADDPTNAHDGSHELLYFSKEQNDVDCSLAISVTHPMNAGSLQQFGQHKEPLPKRLLKYQQWLHEHGFHERLTSKPLYEEVTTHHQKSELCPKYQLAGSWQNKRFVFLPSRGPHHE